MKLKLLFAGLLICSLVSAQDFILKKQLADRYYERFDYYKAIPMYEQLLKSYPNAYPVYEKLADSYYRINDSQNAERYFARLVDTSAVKSDYLLHYAQVLARNGKYSQARQWYARYAEARPDDARGASFAKAYDNVRSFYADSGSYVVQKLPFNSELSDFSPMYYKDGLVFASARHNFSIIRILYNWTYSSYLDLYFAKPDDATASLMDKGINTKYHEGPMTFSVTQDTIIFTRSNFYKMRFRTNHEGINKLKLYQARYDATRRKWMDVTPLPFNSNEYSVGHPALSPNGHDLYFSADMPGGFGGTDLYVSHRGVDSTGKVTWGKPVNLGPEVNSPGNEMFPYIDNEGNLWFASNGLPGLGGLDVFVARKTSQGFAKPENLGFPINTSYDDFAYITRTGGKDGYLSSDRYNSVGNDDIFAVKLNKLTLNGLVCDSVNRNVLLENANLLLLNSGNTVISKATTGPDGKFSFLLNFDQKYSIKVSGKGYMPKQQAISTSDAGASMDVTLPLAKEAIPTVEFFCTIVDKSTGEKLEGVHVTMRDSLSHTVVMDTLTSADGGFRKSVPTVKLNDNLVYKIQISKKGYLARSVLFLHKVDSYEVNLNDFLQVTLDKIDLGIDIGKLLNLKPIYFDLGKANIRSDAAKELDKVVKAMKENPTIRIELGSHTDSRGTATSNMALSERRAKSAAEYLYSKGISRDRVVSKGYGETQPLNRCVKGVKCSEEEYQLNRRTEFKILSVE